MSIRTSAIQYMLDNRFEMHSQYDICLEDLFYLHYNSGDQVSNDRWINQFKGSTYDHYINELRKDRTYSDDLCVYACSKVLNVKINVYNNTLKWLKFNSESSNVVETIHLANRENIHFYGTYPL